jgi:RNA recognition motif-containing protein
VQLTDLYDESKTTLALTNAYRKAPMATKIFVGKLSYDTSEKTLTDLFTEHGEVTSTAVIMDRSTNQSKGFAFIEMADVKAAQNAIKALDGKEVDGRNIVVSAAKEREDKPRHTNPSAGYRRSW